MLKIRWYHSVSDVAVAIRCTPPNGTDFKVINSISWEYIFLKRRNSLFGDAARLNEDTTIMRGFNK